MTSRRGAAAVDRPRVLLVEGSGRGFLSHYVHALALGLSELGHEVCLVTGDRDELADWPVPFAKRACLGRGGAAWLALAGEVVAFNPQVVHFQWLSEPLAGRLFIAWLHRLGIAAAYTPHNVLPHRRRWRSMPGFRGFYRALDRVVARDAHIAWAAEEMLGVSVDQLVHLPGSPNLIAHPSAPRRPIPELAAKAPGARRLLFFGHGCARKGLDHLLTTLAGRDWPDGVHLVLAGEGVLPASAAAVLARARRRLGITVIDRYLDPAEVAALFADSDLLLMPYVKLCRSPIIDLAAAFGLPVLRSDRVEVTRFLDGVHGLTVAHGDVTALGAAIGRFVARPEFGARCRRALRQEESVSDAVRRLAAGHARMYDELAARRRQPATAPMLPVPTSVLR